ncbi:glycosyltransferase involved in cell wall biosynthesis/2-polyprenyl-3-methyl-5-hydroxy-6-metoxy-1,4-benzoquinol methylase [Microvirga flocculans]|uniref:Glycosyltransferase involved in cell wall biosynthesis/2-polyprenyl-3-methyl-5-hydroxy-6-metoxy-1, 4-benzoquinol methylase n=1 Tax=Microvirga flocculans TaxID=217168 RepID=A0A7W6IJW3_9HYPH|nr:glycosyltransferase [Microvirga flocculans]MBB4042179.1 glycosyltransferase involved in cell wall biosynthesis/2-polyprenyl-3-methyl-5-hydroxy-6-metoxy-1,4-benzoquinol methylase [Microvirga flocculans]
MSIIYKHSYVPLSMYGNVMALLREHVVAKGVHIDIGCGYGAIAEPVRDELGLTYLGFDLAEDGLQSLIERGFDAHVIDLSKLGDTEEIIRQALKERSIASISFLDTMEHLTNGPEVLAMLRRLAEGSKAPLVISVPNITHKDVAVKLLTGRLDITEAGILDHTHFNLFNDAHLRRITASRGWIEVGAKDWLLEQSDQFFPLDSPVLDHRTPLGHTLRSLSVQSNKHALVNQFVRAYIPGERQSIELCVDRTGPERPFLTILFDAYDTPSIEAECILQGLADQTNQDFDIVLIADVSAASKQDVVENACRIFSGRITVHESNQGVRADRLNETTKLIAGRHVTILIAGDRVDPAWVSSLAALESHDTVAVLCVGRVAAADDGSLVKKEAILPVPLTGPVSVAEWAVPGSAIRDLGIIFDRDVGRADLRDFVIQSALLYRVSSSAAPVVSRDNDYAAGPDENVDAESYLKLLTKLNGVPILLPAYSAEKIERLSKTPRIVELASASPLLSQFIASFPRHAPSGTTQAKQSGPRPFLSVVMRTQGDESRVGTLREALLTLAGQTSQNFEVLLVVHTSDSERYAIVKNLVAEFPSELTQRIQLLQCEAPGRSSPLNLAVNHIRGQYVAVFDDDDLLFAHWVETFEELAKKSPGTMLRTVTARQEFKMVADGESWRSRAESWFTLAWHAQYDAIEHLRSNFTPFMSMAFPAAVFNDIGLRFDERLSTAEDWQFSTRVAMLCGVCSTSDVTAIYRWWTNGHSSSQLIPRDEWITNRQKIIARLNEQPVLLPPGSTSKLVDLLDEVIELRKKVGFLEASLTKPKAPPRKQSNAKPAIPTSHKSGVDKREINRAQRQLRELLESRSWRSTKPLRLMLNRLRGQKGSGLTPDKLPKSVEANQRLIQQVQKSLSWRITAPLRIAISLSRRVNGKNEK